MSNSALAVPAPVTRDTVHRAGRRRRAAAVQRRIEQQRLGQYMRDREDEIVISPRTANRRRAWRSSRYSAQDEFDDYVHNGSYNDDISLDVALAFSLSLSEADHNRHVYSNQGQVIPDMSYESLVLLENVKCVASSAIVSSLTGSIFEGCKQDCTTGQADELCAICQNEYEGGDHLMLLPCMHNFHHACGSEWLLNYSKLCPVCKLDITEEA